MDAARKIVKKHGLPGFYRGFLPTWGREALGQAAYFVTYETICRQFVRKDQKISQAPLWASLLGGIIDFIFQVVALVFLSSYSDILLII